MITLVIIVILSQVCWYLYVVERNDIFANQFDKVCYLIRFSTYICFVTLQAGYLLFRTEHEKKIEALFTCYKCTTIKINCWLVVANTMILSYSFIFENHQFYRIIRNETVNWKFISAFSLYFCNVEYLLYCIFMI